MLDTGISLWMPPIYGRHGVASIYDPSSENIFAGFVTPPTAGRKALIDQCVRALKAAGVWAKLDALYGFAAADSQAAKVNWINPGTYNCTEVNAPAFAANAGFTGGSTKSLDSGFNATTAPSPKLTQNDISVFAWSSVSSGGSGGAILSYAVNATLRLIPGLGGTSFTFNLLNSTNDAFATANEVGLFSGSREAAATTRAYINGALISTTGRPSVALPNENITFLMRSAAYWTGQISWGGFGSQLSVAEHAALYNALANYMAGLAYAEESQAIFAAFTTPPTTARKDVIDTCVKALKSAGVWAKLDALYAFAAADSQAALINWVAPGTFNGTLVNGPSFQINRGFVGASTKYIDSGFNPTTAPTPKFTQNDANAFAWSLTDLNTANTGIVGVGTVTTLQMSPKAASSLAVLCINAAGSATFAVADGIGLYFSVRTGSTASEMFKNGASLFTSAQNSAAVPNETINFLRRTSGYHLGTIAIGGFGSQLSAADNTALYNALNTYINALTADNAAIVTTAVNAIASAFTTPPTTARRALIENCVTSLVWADIWNRLDAFYAFAAADEQASLINWKAPGTYNATNIGATTFTLDVGFTLAASKYIDSNFNPTTAIAPKFTQNSACAFMWSQTNTNGSGYAIGGTGDQTVGADGEVVIMPRSSGSWYARINNAANNLITNLTGDMRNLNAIDRANAADMKFYRNGVLQGSGTDASVPPLNSNIFCGRRGTAYSAVNCQAFGFGGSLTADQHATLFSIIQAYYTGL